MPFRRLCLILTLLTGAAFGQGFRYQFSTIVDQNGRPVKNAQVRVCTQPTMGPVCNTPATIYANVELTNALPNPFSGDQYGNAFFYAAQGEYHAQVTAGGRTIDIPDILLGADVPDATATVTGKLALAGDLGGTAAAPTVPGLADKAASNHVHDASIINSGVLDAARIPANAVDDKDIAPRSLAVGTTVQAKNIPVDVLSKGAKGDCSSDDTAAIQSALNTCRNVYLPNPSGACYKITAALHMKCDGQEFFGENMLRTIIKQFTASEHGIVFDQPTDGGVSWSANILHYRVTDLGFEGVGAATATGDGVHVENASSPTHSGDMIDLQRVRAAGFKRGFYVNGMGNMTGEHIHGDFNETGVMIDAGGSSNSFFLSAVGTAHNTVEGISVNAGRGNTIQCQDQGSQPVHIHVRGGMWTFLGCNMEIASSQAVQVETNASAVFVNAYVLRGGGADVAPFNAAANSHLVLVNPGMGNFGATTPLVAKAAGAIVQVVGDTATLGANAYADSVQQDGGEVWRAGAFNVVLDNAVPAPLQRHRGMSLFVAGRAGVADDRLMQYYRKSDGTFLNMNLLQPGYPFVKWSMFPATATASGTNNYVGGRPCWAASIWNGSAAVEDQYCLANQPDSNAANSGTKLILQRYAGGSGPGGFSFLNMDVYAPSIKATTGTRYVCIDANGKLVSSTTACSGT